MKQFDRTDYLRDCLVFHTRRFMECLDDETKRRYHRTQVIWFRRKLEAPVRSTPYPAGRPPFVPREVTPTAALEDRIRTEAFHPAEPVSPAKPEGFFRRILRGLKEF